MRLEGGFGTLHSLSNRLSRLSAKALIQANDTALTEERLKGKSFPED